jgi:hypothetical protein
MTDIKLITELVPVTDELKLVTATPATLASAKYTGTGAYLGKYAQQAVIQCTMVDAILRMVGSNPTTTYGMVLKADSTLTLSPAAAISGLRVRSTTAVTSTLHITYLFEAGRWQG